MEHSINYLAVIVAALSAFALGAVWYGKPLFGKAWQKELGYTDEYLKGGNMAKIFGVSFILTLVMAIGMAFLFHGIPPEKLSWKLGLTHGFYIGFAFVATSMGVNYLYQRKSFTLWAIDAGYQVVFLTLMGTILGAWH
jgi:hypothetical protein